MVTFYDGDDLTAKVLGQYGGSRSRFKLYTSTADVTIQFQSDPATNIYGYGNGFVVHFFGEARQETPIAEDWEGLKRESHKKTEKPFIINTLFCIPIMLVYFVY